MHAGELLPASLWLSQSGWNLVLRVYTSKSQIKPQIRPIAASLAGSCHCGGLEPDAQDLFAAARDAYSLLSISLMEAGCQGNASGCLKPSGNRQRPWYTSSTICRLSENTCKSTHWKLCLLCLTGAAYRLRYTKFHDYIFNLQVQLCLRRFPSKAPIALCLYFLWGSPYCSHFRNNIF